MDQELPDIAPDFVLRSVMLASIEMRQSLSFYCDFLGLPLSHGTTDSQDRRFTVVGLSGESGLSIVLQLAPADPGVTLGTRHLDWTFARMEARGAEVLQEPISRTDRPRDCAFLDPAGNVLRVEELR
jgi:catechol 2,3-dioxygenase-like lactoylglutathione lyase family enzyme